MEKYCPTSKNFIQKSWNLLLKTCFYQVINILKYKNKKSILMYSCFILIFHHSVKFWLKKSLDFILPSYFVNNQWLTNSNECWNGQVSFLLLTLIHWIHVVVCWWFITFDECWNWWVSFLLEILKFFEYFWLCINELWTLMNVTMDEFHSHWKTLIFQAFMVVHWWIMNSNEC